MRLILTVAVAIVVCVWGGLEAGAKPRTLEDLAAQADEIIVGKVQDKQVRVISGRFETEYAIEVEEQWKGKNLAPGKMASVTLLGGEITSPPLAQVATNQPYMYVGEEVALFLDTKPRTVSPELLKGVQGVSTLGTTPWVVGSRQGKFTVITDKSDNKKKVARISMETFGILHDDKLLKMAADAAAEHQVRVTSGSVITVHAPAGSKRDPLEITKQVNTSLTKADAEAGLAEIQAAQAGNPIVMQDFQEFKDQVLGLTGNN